MKRILLTIQCLLIFIVTSSGQTLVTTMGSQTEITAGETLTFSRNVDLGYQQKLTIGFEINTVNTSDFEGSFYVEKSLISSSFQPATSQENYTFTHTGGDNETIIMLDVDDWNWTWVKAKIVASSDAQSILITPWIKTTKKP